MTAHWMAYCVAIGAALALAALAAEGAARALGLPARAVYTAALLLSVALPVGAYLLPRPAPTPAAPPAAAAPSGGVEAAPLVARGAPSDPPAAPRWDLRRLDRPLGLAWRGGSAAVLLTLVGLAAALRVRRRGWRAATVDGEEVLLSESTGPAVIGFLRGRIVLPRWVVEDADPATRALLMQHEREHLRAGDPRLLLLGVAVVVALPFSPAAWWMLRRLRLAIEVDCDARVLARNAGYGVRSYGQLLLEVGRRGSGRGLALVGFSEPASYLERRIRTMTAPRPRAPRARAGALGAVASLLVAAAFAGPAPAQREGAADTTGPTLENAREVSTALQREYPPLLRDAGVRGQVVVRLNVDEAGNVTLVDVVSSTHDELVGAARRAMVAARFAPRRVAGRAVATTFDLPVLFTPPEPAAAPRDDALPMAASFPERAATMPRLLNPQDVAAALRAEYPPLLRDAGVGGQVHTRLHIDAAGAVSRVEVLSATHADFGPAAERALGVARFEAARTGERAVPTVVELPVRFSPPPRPDGDERVSARAEEARRAAVEARAAAEGTADRAAFERRNELPLRLLRTHMPDVLRDGTSSRYLWFAVDPQGRVVGHGESEDRDGPFAAYVGRVSSMDSFSGSGDGALVPLRGQESVTVLVFHLRD